MTVFRSTNTRLTLTAFAVLVLTFSVLASIVPGNDPAIATEPSFFTWDEEPWVDGLNHYLVRLEPGTVDDGRSLLVDGVGRLVVSPFYDEDLPLAVGRDELERAVTGGPVADLVSVDAVRTALEEHGGVTAVRPLGFGSFAVAGTISITELRSFPGVARADHDVALVPASIDELYPTQWGLDNDGAVPAGWPATADADVDATAAWHRTRGDGVVVAVIDSGVDVAHPDLAPNIWSNPGETCGNGTDDDANGYVDDCAGWDFVNGDATVEDLSGHGTHVAGIIAAEANNLIGVAGVAYDADVMVLKIGDGAPAVSSAIEAFSYAIENGARIINASWATDDVAAAAFLDPAIAAARDAGVLVVTGAGNDGYDLDVHPVYPAASPHDNVIAVGASTALDAAASFSSYGSSTVDLFAPGEHIVSTLPGGVYGAFSGTSMAAPMVSGGAALLWSATAAAAYDEVRDALLGHVDNPDTGLEAFSGLAATGGRLNLERAISIPRFEPALKYTFYDFNSFEPDMLHDVTVRVEVVDPAVIPAGLDVAYRATVLVPQGGQPVAVRGLGLRHGVGGAERSGLTDTTGRVMLGDPFRLGDRPALGLDGDVLPLRMSLPRGTYAIVLEVVDLTAPAAPALLGEPSAVFFTVGLDGSVVETPPASEPPPDTTTVASGPEVTAGGRSCHDDNSSDDDDSSADGASHDDQIAGCGPTPSEVTTTPHAGTGDAPPNGEASREDGGGSTTTPEPAPVTTTTTPAADTEPDTGPASSEGGATGAGSTTTTTTVASDPEPDPSTTTTTTAKGDGKGKSGAAPTTSTTSTTQPGGMRIGSINPTSGPTVGGTTVTISGDGLPHAPQVLFGSVQASIVTAGSSDFIVVTTRPSAVGTVDVTVRDPYSDRSASLKDAFTYLGEDVGEATTSTTSATTVVPPSSTTTTSAQPTLITGDGSLEDWLESVLVTPDGLDLTPLPADDPLGEVGLIDWVGAFCEQPVCPGWTIRVPGHG